MTFALITEGASEHRIIKHILSKFFKDLEPDINQIQPKVVNDKQETTGGWNEVLKYCEREDLHEILVENDYIVIQIDTDQSQTHPFNVSHTKQDGAVKSVEDLCLEVEEKLTGLVRAEIWEQHSDRIFFAICIHTIECWLLPTYITNNNSNRIRNCFSTLNTELGRRNLIKIKANDKNGAISIRAYETILKNWRRKQDIIGYAEHNFGFQAFIDSLASITNEENEENN